MAKRILNWERQSQYVRNKARFRYTFLLLDWTDPLTCIGQIVAKVIYRDNLRRWYWRLTEVKLGDTVRYTVVPIAHGHEPSLRKACRTAKRAYLYPKPEQKPTHQMTLPLAE